MADRVILLCLLSCIDEARTEMGRMHYLTWSANVSTLFPPSSPLKVKLGDMLNIKCPPDGTSNIWIQTDLRQYKECNCNATAVENPDCSASTAVRHVCHDEVDLTITRNSGMLNSALSFESGTTYYLISYSPGNMRLDGYSINSNGGECLEGYRMAMNVESLTIWTTLPPTIATTRLSDNENNFSDSLKTSTPPQSTTQRLPLNTIIGMGMASSVVAILLIVLVIIASVATLYRCKRIRTLPDESEIRMNNSKATAEASVLSHDNIMMEQEFEAVENNIAYGAASYQEVPTKENVAYAIPQSLVVMSENAAYMELIQVIMSFQ